MKMRIDFYSKDEVAIEIDFSGRNQFLETEMSELFIFICYTLRQFKNLGQHLVAKALAGMLVSKNDISKLLQNSVELPSGESLLWSFKLFASSIAWKTQKAEEVGRFVTELSSQLNFNKTTMQIFDTEFLAKVPRLVKYNGNGNKAFELILSPFLLKNEGFGFLGRDVNFYAFHSVIALIRFLGQKHSDDEIFLKHLVDVAQYCGSSYIFNQIPMDQLALANTILKKVVASPKTIVKIICEWDSKGKVNHTLDRYFDPERELNYLSFSVPMILSNQLGALRPSHGLIICSHVLDYYSNNDYMIYPINSALKNATIELLLLDGNEGTLKFSPGRSRFGNNDSLEEGTRQFLNNYIFYVCEKLYGDLKLIVRTYTVTTIDTYLEIINKAIAEGKIGPNMDRWNISFSKDMAEVTLFNGTTIRSEFSDDISREDVEKTFQEKLPTLKKNLLNTIRAME
jgi:hypothetical protein